MHQRTWFHRRGVAAVAAAGVLALAAGCGVSSPSSPPAANVPAPSAKVLVGLLPSASSVVKTDAVHWPQSPPEDVLVTKQFPTNPNQTFQNLGVSVVRWSPKYHNWNVVWNGPLLGLQQGFSPGHPVTSAITAWKTAHFGQQGLVVGLVDPASLGASVLWGGAELLWIPAHGRPRTLWSATGNHALMDGTVVRQGHALLVRENACWAVKVAPNQHSQPAVTHPSCTDLLASTPGKRLSFTISGPAIKAEHTSVTVPVGSTVVFWPANRAAVRETNHNALVLLGASQNQAGGHGVVLNDFADTMGFWSWTFRAVGTYDFALATNHVIQTGANPPVTWTVHAVAGK